MLCAPDPDPTTTTKLHVRARTTYYNVKKKLPRKLDAGCRSYIYQAGGAEGFFLFLFLSLVRLWGKL
jgi:hypothetical protein